MFTRPNDLTDEQVATAFADHWGRSITEIRHLAVGFGSHHWQVAAGGERWFLSVDHVDQIARARLVAALTTAVALQDDDRPFVVAPLPTQAGTALADVDERYVLAAYPHVDGRTADWGPYESAGDRAAVVERLASIHSAQQAQRLALVDDFAIPRRADLDAASAEIDKPWNTGPFGDSARQLLGRHLEPLRAAFARYDQLVDMVLPRTDDFVVTHGEPHRGNMIFAPSGPSIVDWDTCLLAPAERDLWALIDEDHSIGETYEGLTERTLDPEILALYRLRWDLTEVSLFVDDFRATHTRTLDTETGWAGLQSHLDPTRWDGGTG